MNALARLAGRRPKRIVVLAVLLAVVAGALGLGVADRLGPYSADDPATESVKTSNQLEAATGLATTDNVVVLMRSGNESEVATRLRRDPAIGRVSPPTGSRDGRAAYVVGNFKAGAAGKDSVHRIERSLHSLPGITVGGTETANVAVNQIVQDDLRRAEMLAFPILFLLSFWFFRSLVASLLPLLVGGLSIVFTFLGLRIASEGIDLSVFALNLVTGLGLGLAIDYSLFIVSRYREEIAEHGAGKEALRRTVASAGRTVLFSSLTVAAALASLLIFPQRFIYSMGVGGVMVALLAAAVALLVLPAVLALLGDKVNALSPKRLRNAAEAEARNEVHGFWYRLSRFVMRRPARVAVLSATLLIAIGLPVLGVKFTSVDATVLPKDTPARVVDTALRTEFPPGRATPVVVVAHASEARQFAQRLGSIAGVAAVAKPRPAGQDLTRIDVFTRDSDLSDSSQAVVRKIRALDAPFEVGVAGRTASFVDQKSSLTSHIPIALLWLVLTTFVVLFLFTGSVILPLKALLMNGLTIAAAFGLLVFVFQHGRFEDLLGYVSQGALESSQPVVLFAVAFGLSTDYGVFLLSRIKEARDSGVGDREAVAVGLERTGRIVTAAALLFCVAIGAFATSRIIFIKEVGVGTAVAVLIDATLVRALLVPSLMELLGRWNWWAPRPLRRLHARFGLEDGGRESGALGVG